MWYDVQSGLKGLDYVVYSGVMLDTAFGPPANPAAQCLQLLRTRKVLTRGELIEETGLSQPTVTRAVAKLLDAGLARNRHDLTISEGRGRPTVPFEIADGGAVFAGVAVGTRSTHIGLFDVLGRSLRSTDIDLPAAKLHQDDLIEHIIAGLNQISRDKSPRSVGITLPGFLDKDGSITAPSLGWHNVDIVGRLRYHFPVSVSVAAAVPAILGSELQTAPNPEPTLALFADDSLGAAISTGAGVKQIDVLPPEPLAITSGLLNGTGASSLPELVRLNTESSRARLQRRAEVLGQLTAELIDTHQPETVVVAGSAFIDDPQAPAHFARTVKLTHPDVKLRLIPSHQEIIRAIARAIAIDGVLRDPTKLLG